MEFSKFKNDETKIEYGQECRNSLTAITVCNNTIEERLVKQILKSKAQEVLRTQKKQGDHNF